MSEIKTAKHTYHSKTNILLKVTTEDQINKLNY